MAALLNTTFSDLGSMSVPVSIQHQHRGTDSPLLPHTPAAIATAVYGTSPGSGRTDKHHQSCGAQACRKLYKRVQWDSALDEKEWTVRLFPGRGIERDAVGTPAWPRQQHPGSIIGCQQGCQGNQQPSASQACGLLQPCILGWVTLVDASNHQHAPWAVLWLPG